MAPSLVHRGFVQRAAFDDRSLREDRSLRRSRSLHDSRFVHMKSQPTPRLYRHRSASRPPHIMSVEENFATFGLRSAILVAPQGTRFLPGISELGFKSPESWQIHDDSRTSQYDNSPFTPRDTMGGSKNTSGSSWFPHNVKASVGGHPTVVSYSFQNTWQSASC